MCWVNWWQNMLIWQRITCSILIPSFLVGWNWYKTLPTSLWCRLPIPTCTLIQKWYSPFPWHRRENKCQKFQSGIYFPQGQVIWNSIGINFSHKPQRFFPLISALASEMAQMENKMSHGDKSTIFFYYRGFVNHKVKVPPMK